MDSTFNIYKLSYYKFIVYLIINQKVLSNIIIKFYNYNKKLIFKKKAKSSFYFKKNCICYKFI